MSEVSADSSKMRMSRTRKIYTLLGCGFLWLLIGGAVLAASAMFLVNPNINGGAWLLGIPSVWLAVFGIVAWSIIRSKEN